MVAPIGIGGADEKLQNNARAIAEAATHLCSTTSQSVEVPLCPGMTRLRHSFAALLRDTKMDIHARERSLRLADTLD
jgi:hypothetical protein